MSSKEKPTASSEPTRSRPAGSGRDVLEEWRMAASSPALRDWLEARAPSPDRAEEPS
jgi:hypothetical protein